MLLQLIGDKPDWQDAADLDKLETLLTQSSRWRPDAEAVEAASASHSDAAAASVALGGGSLRNSKRCSGGWEAVTPDHISYFKYYMVAVTANMLQVTSELSRLSQDIRYYKQLKCCCKY